MTDLSPAQRRALEWLPGRRQWKSYRKPDPELSHSLMRCIHDDPPLVERDWFRGEALYRLTPAGLALRQQLAPHSSDRAGEG